MTFARTLTLLVAALSARVLVAQESRTVRIETSDGYRIEIDDTLATFSIEAGEAERDPDRTSEPRYGSPLFVLHRTFAEARQKNPSVIPSVAELAALTSELDDRLIEALELAMDRGIPGWINGRRALLGALGTKVCGDPKFAEACAFVGAAQEIGGAESRVFKDRSAVDAFKTEFKTAALATPSIGIYSSSVELDRIFQQGKFLQTSLNKSGPIASVLRDALRADDGLAAEYGALNDLAAAVTSSLAVPHLLGSARDDVAVFPPSRTPEGDFIRATWGGSRIPEGVSMLREFAAAVRARKVDLVPGDQAGWYDRRIFALEPLVQEGAATESRKIRRGPSYASLCEQSFMALLTRLREAHAKQALTPAGGGAPRFELPVLRIAPSLRVEPQPTLYRRTAESYAWLHKKLDALGRAPLLRMSVRSGLPGLAASNTVGDALVSGVRIYRELERLSLSDLAMEMVPRNLSTQSVEYVADFDPRVAVPLAYDVERQLFRCAAIVGVRTVRGKVSYADTPTITVRERDGTMVPLDTIKLLWEAQEIALTVPVVEEFWVKAPLPREALRKLCDQNVTHERIRAALAALR